MRISERRVGDVTVIDLAGKLTCTDGPGLVKDKITTLVYQGRKNIVLNLAEITYVDSSGLGELVACHLTAERGGAGIKLANAGYRMQDLLVLTKLLTIFESHRSEAAAVESFTRTRIPMSEDFPQALWSRIF
jgi:anti-sigma B factor antagonist